MASNAYLTVPGAALTRDERFLLKRLANDTVYAFQYPIVIVNIGVMWGASMHCLRAGAPKADLIGIDVDYASCKVHLPGTLSATTLIQADSTVYHEAFTDDIHLLFIDGDHRYDTVSKDIAGWTPKVVLGGIVIFHDYAPKAIDLKRDPSLRGVCRAVDEWFKVCKHEWVKHTHVDSIVSFRHVGTCASTQTSVSISSTEY